MSSFDDSSPDEKYDIMNEEEDVVLILMLRKKKRLMHGVFHFGRKMIRRMIAFYVFDWCRVIVSFYVLGYCFDMILMLCKKKRPRHGSSCFGLVRWFVGWWMGYCFICYWWVSFVNYILLKVESYVPNIMFTHASRNTRIGHGTTRGIHLASVNIKAVSLHFTFALYLAAETKQKKPSYRGNTQHTYILWAG